MLVAMWAAEMSQQIFWEIMSQSISSKILVIHEAASFELTFFGDVSDLILQSSEVSLRPVMMISLR